jgi:hypothetical protein
VVSDRERGRRPLAKDHRVLPLPGGALPGVAGPRVTATGANYGERLRTIGASERAPLYTPRTAAADYEQYCSGFLNRVRCSLYGCLLNIDRHSDPEVVGSIVAIAVCLAAEVDGGHRRDRVWPPAGSAEDVVQSDNWCFCGYGRTEIRCQLCEPRSD